jgi:hypothetical protein
LRGASHELVGVGLEIITEGDVLRSAVSIAVAIAVEDGLDVIFEIAVADAVGFLDVLETGVTLEGTDKAPIETGSLYATSSP